MTSTAAAKLREALAKRCENTPGLRLNKGSEMVVEIELRDIYGETKAYPANEQAKLFAQMVGTKTLTHNTLCLIERLGFEIKSKQKGWK